MKRLWTMIACLVFVVPVKAASFDCAKASTKVEKIICADVLLSTLDEVMAITYRDTLEKIADPIAFNETQQAWLKERDSCSDAECVKSAYDSRLSKFGEYNKKVFGRARGQSFPLNPKDPKSVPSGTPQPYTLVMSKDKEFCDHMLHEFNDDLEEHGWVGSEFHEKHEEFESIPWEKARASYEADGRVHYKDVEGALIDFNNDGVQDFVVRDKSYMSGIRADRLIMLDANVANHINELTFKEMDESNNSIFVAGTWGYPLQFPLAGKKEDLWLLAPLRYHNTSYLFMRPISVGFMSNFAVIAKYGSGKFVDREVKIQMEDICYYQQKGAKRKN